MTVKRILKCPFYQRSSYNIIIHLSILSRPAGDEKRALKTKAVTREERLLANLLNLKTAITYKQALRGLFVAGTSIALQLNEKANQTKRSVMNQD